MGTQVVLKDKLVERSERFLQGKALRQYIHTVRLLLYLFFQGSHLPLDYSAAV
jgi:hypothetical protein